jgi:general stress protein 26
MPSDLPTAEASSQNHPADALKKLSELIRDIRVAMLTTLTPSGLLHSRPMVTQVGSADGCLWFFTADDSPKTDEITQVHQVSVTYSDPTNQRYVVITGRARVVHDKSKARELWHPMVETWFPAGLDDPTLALLEVTPDTAEYWDAPSGALVRLLDVAKSAARLPHPEAMGDHGKINFS